MQSDSIFVANLYGSNLVKSELIAYNKEKAREKTDIRGLEIGL